MAASGRIGTADEKGCPDTERGSDLDTIRIDAPARNSTTGVTPSAPPINIMRREVARAAEVRPDANSAAQIIPVRIRMAYRERSGERNRVGHTTSR